MDIGGETLLELVQASRGTLVLDGVARGTAPFVSDARRMATELRRRGVQRGDGVLVVDDGSGADFLAVLLGSWWLGARVAALPPTAGPEHVEAAAAETGAALTVRQGRRSAQPAVSFADLRALGTPPAETDVCSPDDIALDILSSGTTGRPKCVSFTHRALYRNVQAVAGRLNLDTGDVLYSPLAMSLAGVLGMVILPGLLAGSTTHIGRLIGPHVARAYQEIRGVNPTMLYGVPYIYEVLARQRAQRPADRLRWAVCSSAPLPGPTFDRVQKCLGVPARSSYCLAEAGTVTLNTSHDSDELRNSVGSPIAEVEVAIEPADAGAGSPNRDGGVGRVVISGRTCGVGYRQAGVLKAFPGGRIRTKDLGVLKDGVLTITGRMDEVIQVAGQNVDLAHVRRVISHCPGLGDFALVVAQQDRLGSVPVLLAEARSLTVSVGEVLAFCRAELRDVEVPRAVQVVEEIVRTATGKVPLHGGKPE